jgi:hypothetical protein
VVPCDAEHLAAAIDDPRALGKRVGAAIVEH